MFTTPVYTKILEVTSDTKFPLKLENFDPMSLSSIQNIMKCVKLNSITITTQKPVGNKRGYGNLCDPKNELQFDGNLPKCGPSEPLYNFELIFANGAVARKSDREISVNNQI